MINLLVVIKMKNDFSKNELIAYLGRLANKWGTGHQSVSRTLDRTKKFLEEKDYKLSFIDKVEELISMLRDYSRGEFMLDDAALGWIIATLAYLVLPTDLIPDFIAGFGFTDDAAAFIIAFKQLSNELEHYRQWKKLKQKDSFESAEEFNQKNIK